MRRERKPASYKLGVYVMSDEELGQNIEKQPLNKLETLLDGLFKGDFELFLSNFWEKTGLC